MPNSGKGDRVMSSSQFRAWRKTLGLKQKEAADLLGLKKRMIQYYEKGERDGKNVAIPKTVRLACYALMQGIEDFDGSEIKALPASEKSDSA
jgi:transcriptional regulator with XRE-family HTH domain